MTSGLLGFEESVYMTPGRLEKHLFSATLPALLPEPVPLLPWQDLCDRISSASFPAKGS